MTTGEFTEREKHDPIQRPPEDEMKEIKRKAMEDQADDVARARGKKSGDVKVGDPADVQDMPERKSDEEKTEVG